MFELYFYQSNCPGDNLQLFCHPQLQNLHIRAAESPSTQGYTPFEGLELTANVEATFLRGHLIYENGQIIGKPRGQYLHRPTA